MCKYCERIDFTTGNGTYYTPNGGAAIWHGLVLYGIEIRSHLELINYCPWCGRKLEEEE